MPRKQKKYHYIYKTTCDVSGRYYIGMHSTDNLDDGYMGSGKRLWNSFNYHGKDKHSIEILEWFDTRTELREREAELVNEDLLKKDLCMNLVVGGEGGYISLLGCTKGGKTTGTIHSDRMKTDLDYNNRVRKTLSDNRKKMWLNPEISDKMKANLELGREAHTEETKKKIGKANSVRQKGELNSQYGTCWVTKDGETKKVKKDILAEYLDMGWNKGRK